MPEEASQGNAGHILVTTTPALERHHITKYIEVVSAETVLGTSFAYSSNSRSMVSVIVTGTAVNAVPVQR